MIRLAPIFVLFLSSCSERPTLVIPEELLRREEVRCRTGTTSRALGECAIALRSGLNRANAKLSSIEEIVKGPR